VPNSGARAAVTVDQQQLGRGILQAGRFICLSGSLPLVNLGRVVPRSSQSRFEMPEYSRAELNCGVSRLSHSRLFVSAMGKAVGSDIADGTKKFEA
jgi:hypothetical protein